MCGWSTGSSVVGPRRGSDTTSGSFQCTCAYSVSLLFRRGSNLTQIHHPAEHGQHQRPVSLGPSCPEGRPAQGLNGWIFQIPQHCETVIVELFGPHKTRADKLFGEELKCLLEILLGWTVGKTCKSPKCKVLLDIAEAVMLKRSVADGSRVFHCCCRKSGHY